MADVMQEGLNLSKSFMLIPKARRNFSQPCGSKIAKNVIVKKYYSIVLVVLPTVWWLCSCELGR